MGASLATTDYPLFSHWQETGKATIGQTTELSDVESLKQCTECTAAMAAASAFLRKPDVIEKVINTGIKVCELIGFAQPPEEVCTGIVTLMGDVILNVLADKILSKDRICNQALGWCSKPTYYHHSVEDYAAALLADKPEYI